MVFSKRRWATQRTRIWSAIRRWMFLVRVRYYDDFYDSILRVPALRTIRAVRISPIERNIGWKTSHAGRKVRSRANNNVHHQSNPFKIQIHHLPKLFLSAFPWPRRKVGQETVVFARWNGKKLFSQTQKTTGPPPTANRPGNGVEKTYSGPELRLPLIDFRSSLFRWGRCLSRLAWRILLYTK